MFRWVFTDPVTSETYEMEINPNEGGTPKLSKNISYQITTAPEPNSRVLMFEGRPQPRQGSFAGTILTEQHYNAMVQWYEKRNQIYVTDDLGRTFTIYITGFDAKRVRAIQHPWKHTYTCEYTIIDWV